MDQKQFKELKRTIAGGALFIGGVLLAVLVEELGIASCVLGLCLMFYDSLLQTLDQLDKEKAEEAERREKE